MGMIPILMNLPADVFICTTLVGEVTEVLEMDHQLIFSSTTSEVATAASGEPAVLVEHSTQQVAITTVNYNHTGMFTSN
jgi:hypothetical protein